MKIRIISFGDAYSTFYQDSYRYKDRQVLVEENIVLLGGPCHDGYENSEDFRVSQMLLHRCKYNLLSLIVLKRLVGYVANTYSLFKSRNSFLVLVCV